MKKAWCLLLNLLVLQIGALAEDSSSQQALNLTAFSREMFWDEPPSGLYEVDVQLFNATNSEVNGHIMAFADLNGDKYTDIITVDEQGSSMTLHMFDMKKSAFDLKRTITPTDCGKISNVAVGRSARHLRLFITCNRDGTTFMRLFDNTFDVLFDEVKTNIYLEKNSQPFVADFNGDWLEDILFTN